MPDAFWEVDQGIIYPFEGAVANRWRVERLVLEMTLADGLGNLPPHRARRVARLAIFLGMMVQADSIDQYGHPAIELSIGALPIDSMMYESARVHLGVFRRVAADRRWVECDLSLARCFACSVPAVQTVIEAWHKRKHAAIASDYLHDLRGLGEI